MNRRQFLVGAAALARRSRPVALVTADLESQLVVVDLESGRVRGHVATPRFPRSIETVGAAAVVAHSDWGLLRSSTAARCRLCTYCVASASRATPRPTR